MNAASMIAGMKPDGGTILALIRKDLRTLWPFALILAALLVVTNAFFRVTKDYPEVLLDFGASQIHLAPVLFLFHMFGLPAVSAAFIIMLVHQDPATDARNDWMVRPIAALDLVAAKTLVILAVVLVPLAIGQFLFVMTHDGISFAAVTGPIVITLIGCIFMLVVAWLASGPVQALLAPVVLATATLLIVLSLGVTVGMRVIDATATWRPDAVSREPDQAMPIPLPPTASLETPRAAPAPGVDEGQDRTARIEGRRDGAFSAVERDRSQRVIDVTWPVLIAEFLLMLGAADVVLWLLLARRRLHAARMTFLGFFAAAVFLMLLQGSVSTARDEMIAFQRVAVTRPAPPEAERFAAFSKHDANGDQKLDKAEYAAVLSELGYANQLESLWMQRDRDMDGFVTPQEYRAAIVSAPGGPPAPDPQRFAAFTSHDANNDGRLDRNEYLRVVTELGFGDQFETLWRQRDGDSDGFVSAEEYGMPQQ